MKRLTFAEPKLLSDTGSTRATGYCFSNKSVTIDGTTHVVWLDAVSTVCSASYDHAGDEWSRPVRLFDGCDNHTSPALAADGNGTLHMLYGPHGFWGGGSGWNQGRMKHRVAVGPNRSDEWNEETDLGYGATYPSIVHTSEGFDAIAYRGGEAPWQIMFQRQLPTGSWSSAKALCGEMLEPQYTHHGSWIHAAPSAGGTVLYIAAHLYAKERMASRGVVLMMSSDLGQNWTSIAGEPIDSPFADIEAISVPSPKHGRCAGVATDPHGVVHVLSAAPDIEDESVLLSRWFEGRWHTVDVASYLDSGFVSDQHTMTIGDDGTIHIACSALPRELDLGEASRWGHPAHEVFHLYSTKGSQQFTCTQISDGDDSKASWLPSLPHGGQHRPVDAPVLLFTKGEPGEGCAPPTTTEVYAVVTAWG